MITIQWSKTIQFGERTLVILLVSIADTPLCPVQAYLNMQSLVCVSDDINKVNKVNSELRKLCKRTNLLFCNLYKSLLYNNSTTVGAV
jgi:hypothetical protein